VTAAREISGRVAFREVIEPYVRLGVDLGPDAGEPEPGQFYMLTAPGPRAYLPRPLSYMRHDPSAHRVEFLFSVVGEGTAALARLAPGEILPLLGPLGVPFDFSRAHRQVLVGGGRGVAPLVDAAWRAAARGLPVVWLAGARTRAWLYEPELPPSVRRATVTEDGSAGERGLVTDLLDRELRAFPDPGAVQILSCGPHAMLRHVAERCARFGAGCQVALEGPMACGYGVCRGCPVPVRTDGTPDPLPELDPARPTPPGVRYKMCCLDGPVFDAREVLWEWVR
jgi:dihydroorotate dehydrogenase electron transfer subunit